MSETTAPDYAAMYKTLFHTQTKVIQMLQAAQCAAEEIYISSGSDSCQGSDSHLRLLTKKPNNKDDKR